MTTKTTLRHHIAATNNKNHVRHGKYGNGTALTHTHSQPFYFIDCVFFFCFSWWPENRQRKRACERGRENCRFGMFDGVGQRSQPWKTLRCLLQDLFDVNKHEALNCAVRYFVLCFFLAGALVTSSKHKRCHTAQNIWFVTLVVWSMISHSFDLFLLGVCFPHFLAKPACDC